MRRQQSKPHSFFDRIDEQKRALEAEITKTAPGPARQTLCQKARQLDVAAHMNEWLSSPGLQSPR